MHAKTKYWLAGGAIAFLILAGGLYFHQKNHFNKNTTINNVAVGGLTARQACEKLQGTAGTTKVYLNNNLVYQHENQQAKFNASDEAKFQQALNQQFTFLPSQKAVNLAIKPANFSEHSLDAAKTTVTKKVNQLNKNRKAPVDAYALYQDDKVTVVPAVKGNKYDLAAALHHLDQQAGSHQIRIDLHYEQPVTADSKTVKNEQKQLEKLANKQVTYQVLDKKYDLTSNQIITKATYHDGKYDFDTAALDKQVKKINQAQATLGKSFRFKTHDGQEITTTADGSYGWQISSKKAGTSLTDAILNGKQTVNAEHDIAGTGYNLQGLGYGVTSNNGLGNTYAEVSLAEQRAYFYRDGKCVLSTNIVSGTNNEGNKTPKGVWYIMYQQSPSVLRGLNDDGSTYASKVTYWSPFTDTGCGFHDASWRHNWSSTAYLTDGSHGCINMQPSVAGQAYQYLEKNEPVIVY